MTIGPYTQYGLSLLLVKPTELRLTICRANEFYKDGALSKLVSEPVTSVFRDMYNQAFGSPERGSQVAAAILQDESLVKLMFGLWSNQSVAFALEPLGWLPKPSTMAAAPIRITATRLSSSTHFSLSSGRLRPRTIKSKPA